MDIAAMSISMNQMKLAQAVNLKVMSIAMNQVENQSQGLIQAMAKSSDPKLGNLIDLSV